MSSRTTRGRTLVVDGAAGLREPYASLLDPAAGDDFDVPCDVERGELPDVVKAQLKALFTARPDARRVSVRVDGTPIGVATRASLALTDGATAGTGDGDGLSFPLDTAEYRAVEFACPVCRTRVYRSFYDERRIPRCPNPDHQNTVMKYVAD